MNLIYVFLRRLPDYALGNTRGIATTLGHLGCIALEQGDYERATALHEESLALWRDMGDARGSAHALRNLACVALEQEDIRQAVALYRESLTLLGEVGDKRETAACLEGLASLAEAQKQPRRAALLCGAADALRGQIGAPLSPVERIRVERTMALAQAALGDDAYAAAWMAGQTLPLDQAIGGALHETP